MPWVRIDDHMAEHPKVLAAGPLAELLHYRALQYCNRNLTDGFIPAAMALILVNWLDVCISYGKAVDTPEQRMAHDVDPLELAERLVAVELWEETAGGWTIHDYPQYQPTRESVQYKREIRAEAGRLGGLAKSKQSASNGQANAKQKSAPDPVPDPVPVPSLSEKQLRGEAAAPARVRAREAAPSAPPARFAGVDALLRDLPAYHPTAAFYAKLDKYDALDLEEEAIKMAAWVTAQPHRECSVAFVLNWLQKAQAEQTRAPAPAAPRRPRRAPAAAAAPASGGWASSPPEVIDAWLARPRPPTESGPSQ